MATHEFTLIASGVDLDGSDFENRFFDAGCDDATISAQKGAIVMDFAREGRSLAEAISNAVADARRAGATVIRIEPDPLVSLSDIGKRSGLTRAAIGLYAAGERGMDFPAPVLRVTTSSPLWDWSMVAQWLLDEGKISADLVADARVLRRANDELDMLRLDLAVA